MPFTLPELPYAYDALMPYMSKETLEFHHDKHHNAYVVKGNELAQAAGLGDKTLEQVVVSSFKIRRRRAFSTTRASTGTTFISGTG